MEGDSSLLQEAMSAHQAGDLQQAEKIYRQLKQAEPENGRVSFLLGTVLLQQDRFAESIELLESLSQLSSPGPDVHNNLGLAYRGLKQWEAAAGSFQNAVKADPNYPQAYFNFGELLEQAERFADAANCYQGAWELNPKDLQSAHALARVLGNQLLWSEAIDVYRKILELQPDHLESQLQLAYVLARAEKISEAIEVYQGVLQNQPDFLEVHGGLGYLYERQGNFRRAEEHIQHSLRINPNFAEGWNNLGSIQLAQHQLATAQDSFRKAHELKPNLKLAQYNIATTQLMNRDYQSGWQGFEHRIELMSEPPARLAKQDWNGKRISSQKMLVIADQGFGDTLQFARFLKQAQEVSQAEITLHCQPQLLPLLKLDLEGTVTVCAEISAEASYDVQCLLGSLPFLLKCFSEAQFSLGQRIPVPETASEPLHQFAQQLEGSVCKVGVVWSGNPLQARDVLRSCPLETLQPLWDLEGVQWVNLQVDPQAVRDWVELMAISEANMLNAGALIQDFADSAWLMGQLDLVLTVDTATAHLAGSLGVPVWTMLSHTPDWRWQLDREDSPWYPQMKLYRQPAWGDWDSVVSTVSSELQQVISSQKQKKKSGLTGCYSLN